MIEQEPGTDTAGIDRTHKTFVDYIERTRAHYLATGFNNPYAWAFHRQVPFTPFSGTMREKRVALITTAARYQPEKGDQGPHAPYNNDAKFQEVYVMPNDPPPDLRISHIGYDRNHTVPADINAYFPLHWLQEAEAAGRIGSLAPRFYGVPTLRSQRATVERDAPLILEMCRQDGVEAAILPAV